MERLKFNRELYARVALIKAAYNFTDVAYIHLDADADYYYVDIEPKQGQNDINEQTFVNEMLAQSVRHEVYKQTKNIRELLMARTMATSLIVDESARTEALDSYNDDYQEDEILKDWFEKYD